VLERAQLLEGFVALDRSGGSEEEEAPPGAQARDGVFTGNLNLVGTMQRGAKHERHWVTVTPNSTFVPKELLGEILKLPEPRILSCSAWGTTMIAEALCEMGLRYVEDGEVWCTYVSEGVVVQVHTVRHGVSGFAPVPKEIEKTREAFSAGEFRVAHFSTTSGERKGTVDLIEAWMLLGDSLPPRAELFLILDPLARAALVERFMDRGIQLPTNISLLPRGDMLPKVMASLLGHMHVIACPSRAEGFGLTPLEARASGVPCIATITTGHSAGHVRGGGVIGIDQLPELVPIDDGPAALAQAVRPEDIASALRAAHADWIGMSQRAVSEAPAVIEEWSWDAQLAQLVEHLR
jgi:glycosyltransferase involved in cell wall biosynthesis